MGMESKFIWMNGELGAVRKSDVAFSHARVALWRGGVRRHSFV